MGLSNDTILRPKDKAQQKFLNIQGEYTYTTYYNFLYIANLAKYIHTYKKTDKDWLMIENISSIQYLLDIWNSRSILSQYSNRNGRHLALIDPYLSFGEVPSEVIELPSEIYGEETFSFIIQLCTTTKPILKSVFRTIRKGS